ncbi:MAG: HIT family protein [Anaerolineae bacterium]
MNKLWSPWRMEYVSGQRPEGCVFCDLPKADKDADNLILYRAAYCFVMLNKYPYTNGHLMVVPYVHCDAPTALPHEALAEMMELVNLCIQALHEALRPDGYNVGMNLGASAGAGIKDHIHMHVVPRWTGDTNFMPVLGETRIICDSLDQTYCRLKPVFDRLTAATTP